MSGELGPAAALLQMTGQIYGGFEADRAGRAQGAAYDEQARRTILQGEYDAQGIRRDERAASGDMIAAQGASGLLIGSGSLADMLAQNAYNREVDILNIRTKATGDANAYRAKADESRIAGRAALTQSLFSASSTALTAASNRGAQRDIRAQRTIERDYMLGGGSGLYAKGGIVVNSANTRAPQMRVLD